MRYMSAVVFLVGVALGPTWGHVGTRLVEVLEVPAGSMPDLDGDLVEWEEAFSLPSFSTVDFVSLSDGGVMDPTRIAVVGYLGWSAEEGRILIGVEFAEDALDSRDVLQVKVDGDHSGGSYSPVIASEDQLGPGTHVQVYDFFRAARNDGQVTVGDFLDRWVRSEPWTEIGHTARSELPAQSILEVSLTPWDRFGANPGEGEVSELRAGRILGLQITVSDFVNGELDNVYFLGTGPGEVDPVSVSADGFIDGLLTSCDLPGCSETSVEADSWGRIKASLAID